MGITIFCIIFCILLLIVLIKLITIHGRSAQELRNEQLIRELYHTCKAEVLFAKAAGKAEPPSFMKTLSKHCPNWLDDFTYTQAKWVEELDHDLHSLFEKDETEV